MAQAFHLFRFFKLETGFATHQTLIRLRLRQSLEDLKETARSITGAALGLGFSSRRHFTAALMRPFGLTPSAFRAAFA
ncbi:MAG TPA: AraC family transcriptional regulator [Sphingomonadales bacterium]|nr:AraC family transcriptional regulator [Sphingomonadales bacterium]